MPPSTIAIVGYSNSGKTKVASSLVSILCGQGFRIAFVKHCHNGHEVDRPDTDTGRVRKAGAVAAIASSPGHLTRMEYNGGHDLPLESIVRGVEGDVDLVIAEGFKGSSYPKVLVAGREGVIPDVENILALVSDAPAEGHIQTYSPGNLYPLAEQIREQFLDAPAPGPAVLLEVDGALVPLKQYPSSALSAMVQGFISSLKGVPDQPKEIKIRILTRDTRPTAGSLRPGP